MQRREGVGSRAQSTTAVLRAPVPGLRVLRGQPDDDPVKRLRLAAESAGWEEPCHQTDVFRSLTLGREHGIFGRMELILALACDQARERGDGKLDVLGIFNELNAPGFPAMQDQMTVVFVVEWAAGEEGRQPLRVDLVDERKQKVLTIQGHTEVTPYVEGRPPPQTRLVMPVERVIFPRPGRYTFELTAAGATRSAFSMFVGERPEGSAPD